jgi:tRNA (guanine10-N2)-dimethyltransferase
MKLIFLLSGDYIQLAKEEIASVIHIGESKLKARILIADSDDRYLIKKSKRLALTKGIYGYLFECGIKDLVSKIKGLDFTSYYKDSFCLRVMNFTQNNKKSALNDKKIENNFISERELGAIIFDSLKNPKVDLFNPKTLFQVFVDGNKAYFGVLIKKFDYKFDFRKPHLRPFSHPGSLHPKLAKALINISGITEENTLVDPFCGTGGFLIESSLMGIKSKGYDINQYMVNGCDANISHFKIKDSKAAKMDALKIKGKIDYVITDLPYGLNSNAFAKTNKINLKIQKKEFLKNLEKFYLDFLIVLRKCLRYKAVIVFPNYVNYKKIIKKSGFKIEKEFSDYVHGSLTRKVARIS